MSFHHKYVGLPFVSRGRDMDGVDCWGLVRLIYQRELQITLPSYGEIYAEDLINVSHEISAGKDFEFWTDIKREDIQPFDVVVMKFYGSRRIGHVGIMIDNKNVLHTERSADSAIVPLDHFTIRERIECFRRHKEKTK